MIVVGGVGGGGGGQGQRSRCAAERIIVSPMLPSVHGVQLLLKAYVKI